MTKTQKITYYVLLVIVTLVFLMASVPKLLAEPQAAAGFAVAGLPVWFMYLIGILEIVGLIGLWIPSFMDFAVIGLSIILIGAIVTTAAFMSVPFALFPLAVFLMLLGIAYLGRHRGPIRMA
jgi:putative oxidoreductase